MKIFIGADHRGFDFKTKIIKILKELGLKPKDLGTYTKETSSDYPLIAYQVASRVAKTKNSRGILVCMSGIGQSIAANKVRGVYAALCYNPQATALSRRHNNANILILSAKFIPPNQLRSIIKVWFEEKFEGGRHLRRVREIKKIEEKEFK